MRLFLAVAVLMLAFVAYTEAQEEETFQQKISRLADKLTEIGRQAAGKVVDAYETIRDSEPVVKSREWASEQAQRLRERLNQ